MYLEFFGFKEEPFDLVYNPELLYLSPSHEAVLETLMGAVKHRRAPVVISGEKGIGKTAILNVLIERLNHASVKTSLIPDARLPFRNLLLSLYQRLNLGFPAGRDLAEALCRFEEALIEVHGREVQFVLVVDDAHNLPMETLQHLDWWYASRPSCGPFQILLAGRPELEEKLKQKELQSFNQSIGLNSTLVPLTNRESFDYIHHRLSRVGAQSENIPFTWSALRRIVEYAEGNPHQINILCNNALISSYQLMKTKVSLRIVKEVISNLEGKRRRWSMRWAGATVLAGLLILAAVQLSILGYGKAALVELVRMPFLTVFKHEDAGKRQADHEPSLPTLPAMPTVAPPPQISPDVAEEPISRDRVADDPLVMEPEPVFEEKPAHEPQSEPTASPLAAEEMPATVPEAALPEELKFKEEQKEPHEAGAPDRDPAHVVDWLINMKRSRPARQ